MCVCVCVCVCLGVCVLHVFEVHVLLWCVVKKAQHNVGVVSVVTSYKKTRQVNNFPQAPEITALCRDVVYTKYDKVVLDSCRQYIHTQRFHVCLEDNRHTDLEYYYILASSCPCDFCVAVVGDLCRVFARW